MEMSSVAISAPSAPPNTAIQSPTEAFFSVTGAGLGNGRFRIAAAAGVDVHGDRQPRYQYGARFRRQLEANAHWHTLHDLREVAGRVLGREQSELRTRAGGDAHHRAIDVMAGQ